MDKYYSVKITKHDDPDSGASFHISPPISYLGPESRAELEATVRQLILDRMGNGEDYGLRLAITHDLPDHSATVGRAYFRGLQLATGIIVLQQALEKGLNGSNEFVSPASPLND